MIKKYCCGSLFTNTYLILKGSDAVIVDPGLGFEEFAQEINETYNVIGILLTHGHIDHISSIGEFSCPIYLSKLESDFLKDSTLSLASLFRMKHNFSYNDLDVHLLDFDAEFIIGEMEFKMISTPGHTIGSVCYLYRDNLFSGDTLFFGSQGRTDFPTGNEIKMRESLRKIMMTCNDNVKVYPGHDEKTTIKQERQTNSFVIKAMK